LGVGFRAKAIGFSDNRWHVGRCVWWNAATRFSELKVSGWELKSHQVPSWEELTFLRHHREYSFLREYVVESEDGAGVVGRQP
jgi:hypothetical protein